MAEISITIDAVRNSTKRMNSQIGSMNSNWMNLVKVNNGLDYRIGARRRIGERLSQASNQLLSVEGRLKKIAELTGEAAVLYDQNETKVVRAAELVGKSPVQTAIINYINFLNDYANPIVYRNALLLLGANLLDADKLLIASDQLRFKFVDKNGNVHLKIPNDIKNIDYSKYRNLLSDALGGTGKKWDSTTIERMLKDGLFIYGKHQLRDENGKLMDSYTKRSGKFMETDFPGLNSAIAGLKDGTFTKMGKAAWEGVKDNAIYRDFTGWGDASKLTKVGKAAGIAGTVLTIGENAFTYLYDKDTGSWTTKNIQQFAVSTTVDVAGAVGSMAAGAAVGSLFLPPVGTVVGAGVGVVANIAINHKFEALGNKSITDFTKEGLNTGINYLREKEKELNEFVGKKATEAKEYVSQKATEAVGYIGGKINDVGNSVKDGLNNIGKSLSAVFW
ncbi:hypothetical protein D3P09_16700 [Paenibacillus pinisoli]|uniref:LXG domain-containing protein n=1 Tax=Paenibacillus pinisoli TaxID=1276110 RepID=A0A3A6PR38_9BACL|nr:hypothetical protein [Paenibacillus pinisoli]RJX39131.1 hypothetical protein D3P09_16700 [Paenibacillus pinisoli]